jgi:hypothetical protein
LDTKWYEASAFQLPNVEGLTIYIYKSGEDRESGLKDFNKQKEKYDMALPSIYENRNSWLAEGKSRGWVAFACPQLTQEISNRDQKNKAVIPV